MPSADRSFTDSTTDSTTDDDEHLLRQYADALVVAVEDAMPRWIRATIASRLGSATPTDHVDVERLAASETARVTEATADLVSADIDDQRTNPLSVIRSSVHPITEFLLAAGAPPVHRDVESVRLHPDDVYGITPASFADVDPALHLPGLEWGAAKAHVHLRRRSGS